MYTHVHVHLCALPAWLVPEGGGHFYIRGDGETPTRAARRGKKRWDGMCVDDVLLVFVFGKTRLNCAEWMGIWMQCNALFKD